MNVLLVDDDYYVVTALEKKIDWRSLNIDAVYTANSAAQAREIIRKHPVHILISDIEMPQGSGLELLAWIREENYAVQAILLTNYADFNYAQKAIELQSFEYFLKPIQFDKLMLIIRKAVARAEERLDQERAIREGYYWQKNQSKILEHFWRKIASLSASFCIKRADIIRALDEQNLSYQLSDTFQPLLFEVYPYDGSMGKEEKGLFDFALLNVLYELLQGPNRSVESILELKEGHWIAILKQDQPCDSRILEELCHSFILQANRYLKCDAICTLSPSGRLEDIGQVLKSLLKINEEFAKCRNRTYLANDFYHRSQADYSPPNPALLEELLHQNRQDAFLNDVVQYLRGRLVGHALSRSVLGLFRQDIVQIVYAFLTAKGIQAHKLYGGSIHDRIEAHSLDSIEDMEAYLSYLVRTALAHRDFAAQPQSVVEEIRQYILSHIGADLSRNRLAEIVYLHPDYLARLFKKETGVPLGSYVIQARVEAAKRLLETTNLSVYAVADKVGYANYSYFSKLFKQGTGMSPNEYKRVAKGQAV